MVMFRSMKKRISILLTFAFLTISLLIITYYKYKPKEAALVKNNIIAEDNALTYANIESHIMKDDKVHYLWVCSLKNADCMYTKDYVIKALSSELDEEATDFDYIEFVDFSEAPDTVHYRQSHWNIQYYPAFIACQKNGDTIEILNTLSWSKESPITSDALKKWMYDNDIWSGEYEELEFIEKASE